MYFELLAATVLKPIGWDFTSVVVRLSFSTEHPLTNSGLPRKRLNSQRAQHKRTNKGETIRGREGLLQRWEILLTRDLMWGLSWSIRTWVFRDASCEVIHGAKSFFYMSALWINLRNLLLEKCETDPLAQLQLVFERMQTQSLSHVLCNWLKAIPVSACTACIQQNNMDKLPAVPSTQERASGRKQLMINAADLTIQRLTIGKIDIHRDS